MGMKPAVSQEAIEIRAWRTLARLLSIYINSIDSHSIVKLPSASKVLFFSASISWAALFPSLYAIEVWSCYLENIGQLLGSFSLITSFLECQMQSYRGEKKMTLWLRHGTESSAIWDLFPAFNTHLLTWGLPFPLSCLDWEVIKARILLPYLFFWVPVTWSRD